MQILLYDNDKLIDINNIKDVKQELDLYKGIVTSSFNYKEKLIKQYPLFIKNMMNLILSFKVII